MEPLSEGGPKPLSSLERKSSLRSLRSRSKEDETFKNKEKTKKQLTQEREKNLPIKLQSKMLSKLSLRQILTKPSRL